MTLAERHDLLRRRVMAIAEHMRIAAAINEQNAPFGGAEARAVRLADAAFLRGEADCLSEAAEEIE